MNFKKHHRVTAGKALHVALEAKRILGRCSLPAKKRAWDTFILPLQTNAMLIAGAKMTGETIRLYSKVYSNFFSRAKPENDKLTTPRPAITCWIKMTIKWVWKLINKKLECHNPEDYLTMRDPQAIECPQVTQVHQQGAVSLRQGKEGVDVIYDAQSEATRVGPEPRRQRMEGSAPLSLLARGPLAYKTKPSENRLFNRLDLCHRALTYGIDRTFPTIPLSWASMEKELERVVYPIASKLNADMGKHFGMMDKLSRGDLRNQHDWYNDERRRIKKEEKIRKEKEKNRECKEEEKKSKITKKPPGARKTTKRTDNAEIDGQAKAGADSQPRRRNTLPDDS